MNEGYFKTSIKPVKNGSIPNESIPNMYTGLPKELKELIAQDLDCESIISLIQTSKENQEYLLRQNLKSKFNTSLLTYRQLVNLCYSKYVKMVGNFSFVLLNRKGDVYVFGDNINQYGLGIGSEAIRAKVPIKINFDKKVIDVSTGFMNILLLTDQHQIYYTGEEITPDVKY